MTESGEIITKRNNDEFYVNITFKIKYKFKNVINNNKKQKNDIKKSNILEGYTTINNVVLKNDKDIGKILSDFIREQPTYMSGVNYFYLQRNGKIIKEMNKRLKLFQNGIKNGDEIIITDEIDIKKQLDEQIRLNKLEKKTLVLKNNKKKITLNDDFSQVLKSFLKNRIDKSQIKLLLKDKNEKANKNNIIKYIILFLLLILILGLIGIGAYFYLKEEKKENKPFIDEELIIDVKYIPNMIYRYNFKKKLQMKTEGGSINEENSTKEIVQNSDFFLIIGKERSEENNETFINKKWYTGYLAIVNLSFLNETGATEMIYDKYLYNTLNQRNLNNYLNKKNNKKINLDNSIGNITFVKIEFYENGEIKNIYYPKDIFLLTNMMYIQEYFNLIIPKISPDLYTDSINDTLNNFLLNNSLENDEEFSDFNDTKDSFENNDTFSKTNDTTNDINDLRYLEQEIKKKNK